MSSDNGPHIRYLTFWFGGILVGMDIGRELTLGNIMPGLSVTAAAVFLPILAVSIAQSIWYKKRNP